LNFFEIKLKDKLEELENSWNKWDEMKKMWLIKHLKYNIYIGILALAILISKLVCSCVGHLTFEFYVKEYFLYNWLVYEKPKNQLKTNCERVGKKLERT